MPKLGKLIQGLAGAHLKGSPEVEITGLSYDSRQTKKGDLFISIKGLKTDGRLFIEEAKKRGAVAVVTEEEESSLREKLPTVIVSDTREVLAFLAHSFYHHPSQRLKIVGITGTAGKTTTSYLTRSILEVAGFKTGLIGTINYYIKEKKLPAPHTTPESLNLVQLLSQMVEAKIDWVVMEVSSHALQLERVRGTKFDLAVFTNFSQDHLDFHKTKEAYLKAKLKLFQMLQEENLAVINVDDPVSKKVKEHTKAKIIGYGLENKSEVRGTELKTTLEGLTLKVNFPGGVMSLDSILPGRHNAYNLLAAFAVGISLGLNIRDIKKGLEMVRGVAGRFERIEAGQNFSVIVDYAHTPEELERLLTACKPLTQGRLITVFGCGGDRDQSKRPLMGAIAERLSDYTIVTSDNPRTEDPEKIIHQILSGIKKQNYKKIVERRQAIREAVKMAEPKDVIVIAGKGHEDYQIIGEKKIHFDDAEVVREILAKESYGRNFS